MHDWTKCDRCFTITLKQKIPLSEGKEGLISYFLSTVFLRCCPPDRAAHPDKVK